MHGTFYVTHAVGHRWIAGKRRERALDCRDLDHQRRAVRRAVGDEQGRGRDDDASLAVEWARYGIRLNAIGPGEFPTEGAGKRLRPGEEPGARSSRPIRWAGPAHGRAAEPRDLPACAGLRMAHRRDHHDRRRADLFRMAAFYELREWGDEEWRAAREAIRAVNEKDRAARGASGRGFPQWLSCIRSTRLIVLRWRRRCGSASIWRIRCSASTWI